MADAARNLPQNNPSHDDPSRIPQQDPPPDSRPQPGWSRDQFLAWEDRQEARHEWIGGTVHMQAGGRLSHVRVVGATYAVLRQKLAGMPCEVFPDGVRLEVEDDVFSPDLMVVCGERLAETATAVTAPALIAEVLSEGTEARDRGDKWAAYRRLPSLQAYLLIAPDTRRVEAFRRDGADWRLTDLTLSDRLTLTTPPVSLAVSDLFVDLA